MPHAATMDDELFRALRDDAGMPEAAAAKVAQLIFRQGESAARAEREAARAGREAERAADREAFAAKGDVTVLQTKVKTVENAIISINKRLDHIDATIVEIKETAARTDEKINGLQAQNSLIVRVLIAVFTPLQLLTLGALIGLLTRGILWGVAP